MKKQKWIVGFLAMTLTLSMAGCKATGNTHTSTTEGESEETQTTTETTASDPTETVDSFYPEELTQLQILRIEEKSRAILENLIANNPGKEGVDGSVTMFQFKDYSSFVDFLPQFASEKATGLGNEYNEAFFKDYDLVLIPRVTNSGGVRYDTKVLQEGGQVVVDVTVEVPEITTADMASWFLLVPVPKDMVKDGASVVARMGGNFGSGFGFPVAPTTGTVSR